MTEHMLAAMFTNLRPQSYLASWAGHMTSSGGLMLQKPLRVITQNLALLPSAEWGSQQSENSASRAACLLSLAG